MAAIGIDLGTTNSVGTYYDGKEARILRSARSDGLVPSVVAYRKPRQGSGGAGEMLVGQPALDYAVRDPENTIFSIKRLMGRTFDEPDVKDAAARINYKIAASTDSEDAGVRVLLGGKEYTPVDISALILKQIKEDAEQALGQAVTHAVITVPAYFEDRQRAATRMAGEKAGLIVKKIIDEPSAAAIAYGFSVSTSKRQQLLVFDLGGGTFDVSIILTVIDQNGKNHFEVLETCGDNLLGGDDFDREIVQEIISWIETKFSVDPSGDRAFQMLAKQAAERAKITLTSSTEADIFIPAAYKPPDGNPIDLDMNITREHFRELIQSYVDRCMKHVREALTRQGLTPDDIDNVLMVGGSTLVPLVFESVANFFGKEKLRQVMNPYHSVAQGAGILAATLKGLQCPNEECRHINDESERNCTKCSASLATSAAVSDGSTITEVAAMSFGISAVRDDERDAFEVIIPKGTIYPLDRPKSRTFETTAANFVRIPVYEGNDPVASKNSFQGDIQLTEDDFRQAGADVPAHTPLEVSMNYSRDRELHVKVRIHGTNNMEKEMKILHDRPQPKTVAAPQADDKWKTNLENIIRLAENFRGKYMGFMEPREQLRLDRDVENAQKALDADNPVQGQEAYNILAVTLDSCGVASLLLLADRVQEGAAPERSKRIGEAISKIKEQWFKGDKQALTNLTTPLRAAIASELSTRRNRKEVTGQEDFGGRLRALDKVK